MSYYIKANKGYQWDSPSWKEYPGYGKQWRDAWDRVFGSKSESRRQSDDGDEGSTKRQSEKQRAKEKKQ
jgi:sterol desaturase/sphingolipid hydroxylase (fatty acid hydroxylase superfamily)